MLQLIVVAEKVSEYKMEVVGLLIFLAFGMEINKNADEIAVLRQDVVTLEDNLLVWQGAHAALHARTRVDHDAHHRKIDNNIEYIKHLKKRLNSHKKQIKK